jgi:hypothetical protein
MEQEATHCLRWSRGMGSGSATSRNNLPPTHGSGNEGPVNIQLYLYQRITELLPTLKPGRFTAYCSPYRKFTLSAQLMAT